MPQNTPESVVVLRFSALGDIVLTTGVLETLRGVWPSTRIIYATKASFVPLVSHHPAVDTVVALEPDESFRSYRQRLASHHPGAALDLHAKMRSALLRQLAPGHRRVVWQKRPAWQELGVRLRLCRYRAQKKIVSRYHDALERLVGKELAPGMMRLHLSEEDRAQASRLLKQAGISPEVPTVGLAPGALWPTKRWPTESFVELARRAVQRGCRVVVTGSAREADICAQVSTASKGIVDLSGRLSIGLLGAIIDRCNAFVANDSGPMHMARALGVPTITFFGSTDPDQFDFTGHALMYADIECSPCSLYGLPRCPRGHLRCLRELSVDEATHALERALEGGRRPLVAG